jgi:hypothetical protein
MTEPNFIIGGGVASGTSFLSTTLKQHPQIYLPVQDRPEPNFFHYSWKYQQGIDWWLENWFSDVQQEKAIGERSSLLLSSEFAADRIKQAYPNMKLIFCLRNPIERAWANYRFSVLEGLEPLSFFEAISSEAERMEKESGRWAEVQPHAYVSRSRYARQLESYFEKFGRSNVLVLKSEALSKEPNKYLRQVCRYLGVDEKYEFVFPPSYTSPVVRDRVLQTEIRNYFGDQFSEIVELVRLEKVNELPRLSSDDPDMIAKLLANLTQTKEAMPEEARLLLNAAFATEKGKLSKLLEFSIEDWK